MRFSLNNALAALLVFAVPAALAQAASDPSVPLEPSAIEFRILGPQTGTFVIATPNGDQAVRYDLATGRVSFRTLDYVGLAIPLFCFDFSGQTGSQLSLDVTNSNGHPALDGVRLSSALLYRLEPRAIEFTPDAQTQCFYIGDGDASVFGLFGMAPPAPREDPEPDPDLLFQDGFELFTDPRLTVSFQDLPSAVSAGADLTYTLVIENSGDTDLSNVAFQEVFPANTHVFPAALGAGSWNCSGAACEAATGTGLIRFSDAELAVGESVSFEITRPVAASAQAGAQISLFAGAVNGAGAAASFGADQAEISVIGPPAQLAFTGDVLPVGVGETVSLAIEVQDANGNRIPVDDRTIQVTQIFVANQGSVILPSDGFLGLTDGRVEFPVIGEEAGNVRLLAQTVPADQLTPAILNFVVTSPP